MTKYLIEVPHEPDEGACIRAVQSFLMTGSHFLTNADWGSKDGEHKAWILLDVDSRDDARSVLPPNFRPDAKIVKLNRFTMQDVDEIVSQHQP